MTALPANGLFVAIDGEERPLLRKGQRWYALFNRLGKGNEFDGQVHRRFLTDADDFDVVRVSVRCTFTHVPVDVMGQSERTVHLVGRGDSLRHLGFTQHDRNEWVKTVPLDDPDLRVAVARTLVPAPWRTA